MLAAREGAAHGPGRRIGEIVEANPEDAAGIVRSWISEGAA
jgi:flagellar biosynthesis/type III secretory pathway M-ring protein FliF/YscJ